MSTRYVDDHERALVARYREADEARAIEGEAWYRSSRKAARRIAREAGITVSQAAGVIAALSPRMRWGSNINVARAMCLGQPVTGVFGANLRKAERILAGERPLSVLGGDKVRSFYRAIMGDGEAVVLDVWMMRASGWVKPTLTSAEYEALSTSLRAAARRVGVDPADFQAIVWTHVRGGGE